MAFGFADSAGPLFSRLRFLALDALCIGVGAGLGSLVGTAAAFPRTAVTELDSLVEEEPDAAGKERSGRTPRASGE